MLQAPILLYSLQQPVLFLNKLAKGCIKLLYLLIIVSSTFLSNQAAAQKKQATKQQWRMNAGNYSRS